MDHARSTTIETRRASATNRGASSSRRGGAASRASTSAGPSSLAKPMHRETATDITASRGPAARPQPTLIARSALANDDVEPTAALAASGTVASSVERTCEKRKALSRRNRDEQERGSRKRDAHSQSSSSRIETRQPSESRYLRHDDTHIRSPSRRSTGSRRGRARRT